VQTETGATRRIDENTAGNAVGHADPVLGRSQLRAFIFDRARVLAALTASVSGPTFAAPWLTAVP